MCPISTGISIIPQLLPPSSSDQNFKTLVSRKVFSEEQPKKNKIGKERRNEIQRKAFTKQIDWNLLLLRLLWGNLQGRPAVPLAVTHTTGSQQLIRVLLAASREVALPRGSPQKRLKQSTVLFCSSAQALPFSSQTARPECRVMDHTAHGIC